MQSLHRARLCDGVSILPHYPLAYNRCLSEGFCDVDQGMLCPRDCLIETASELWIMRGS